MIWRSFKSKLLNFKLIQPFQFLNYESDIQHKTILALHKILPDIQFRFNSYMCVAYGTIRLVFIDRGSQICCVCVYGDDSNIELYVYANVFQIHKQRLQRL